MVPQHEIFSPANQGFLVWLRTFCDTVLHTYLSGIADTAEKRNFLRVLYTTAITSPGLSPHYRSFEVFLKDTTRILELYPPTFHPCGNPHVLLDAMWHWKAPHGHLGNYLRDFLWNPVRSKLFHCDPGLWSAVVAARYMRYLRTASNLGFDIRFKRGYPTF